MSIDLYEKRARRFDTPPFLFSNSFHKRFNNSLTTKKLKFFFLSQNLFTFA